jgi:4-nitrophenyl phosphatase
MLASIRNLILDMDGVLWRGDVPMPGLVAFFDTLRQSGINYVLATNNATKTPEQYTLKLARMGVAVSKDQILTSAEVTATYLSDRYPAGTPVYIIGTTGLHDAMGAKGFEIIGADDVEKGAAASLVVAGFTPDAVYRDLAMGSLLVHKGATFVGTNPDPSIPSELGPLPGAGALFAVISTATGVEPITIGKPGPIIFEESIRLLGSAKADTAMVGDRLSTDIAGAKSAGLYAIMLLSGISTREDIQNSDIRPDFVFADIAELTNELMK